MTYLLIVLPFVAATAIVVAVSARRPRFGRRMAASGIAAGVLVVLTAIFDNLMIAAGLFTLPGRAPQRAAHRRSRRSRTSRTPSAPRSWCPPSSHCFTPTAWRVRHDRRAALGPAAVARQLLVASRPVSWINTAYPFAAAYLLTTREVDLTFVVGTLFFLVPYNLAMYGVNDVFDYESDLRNPRKGGAHGAVLDPRLHRITLWAAALACLPFVVYLVRRRVAVVVAGAGREPVLRRLLQRSAAAAEGGAVRGLDHEQHPLLLARRVRAGARRRGSGRGSSSP